MALTLSTTDLTKLEQAFTTLVSPFSHPSVMDWRVAVREQLVGLLGADRSASMLPIAGEQLTEASPGSQPAIDAYVSYYHAVDTGVAVVRKQRGLEVFDLADIYDLRALPRMEFWNDWLVPSNFYDALSIAIDIDPALPPAGWWFYHEQARAPKFGERGPALLRLLLPALKAGLHSVRQLAKNRTQLLHVLDGLHEGALVVSAGGVVLHESVPLRRLLTEDPDATRLRAEMQRIALVISSVIHRRRESKVGRLPVTEPASREIRTSLARYRLSGSWLEPEIVAAGGAALVTLERLTPRMMTGQELRDRFGFTPREVEVSRLVALGKSAPEIARELNISPHTARHHVEALRRKMGVRHAGEIAARLALG